ncbi:hypothetical protein Acor_28970 [Acrocarpospora corrugata]|uniref:Uncharacterized protein n=1 Tax=Acrocarpospora corrugata TaxID=35763 RepID=A0A5M3W0L9_9ACTN|nr:hypothetical protein [Acrocarpospora corrugata]GES00833.1 hypothetical protein Acor_28970 [Acrocarpospora corrugata]
MPTEQPLTYPAFVELAVADPAVVGLVLNDLYVVLADGATTDLTQRQLFAHVEAAARRAGRGAVPDAWGEDLDLMRPR